MSTILITGASSGIGFDVAKALALRGHLVFAAARSMNKLETLRDFGIVPIELDVTSAESIQQAVTSVQEQGGRIDVLINNAGYGEFGALEDVSLAAARKQFDVNVFGLVEMTKAVLPGMREQGAGRIINVSSMGGKFVSYFGNWYHASKYAVEALSDGLRMETAVHGIDVVLIEPSAIKTPWGSIAADNLEKSSAAGAYGSEAKRAARGMRKLYAGSFISGPEVVVKAIVQAVEAKKPRTRYLVGRGARALVAAHAVLPDKLFDALMRRAV
ncbi:oxidoreductase [Staphylococcus chromogenes]|nr:oxidoreductase [Staphylococcus chromogenes]